MNDPNGTPRSPLQSAVHAFEQAQQSILDRFQIAAESIFVELDSVDGPVHLLRAGSGPPVVMVPGFADPGAMWASLMAQLDGFTLYAVDRPCFGLSGQVEHTPRSFRRIAMTFLIQLLDALGIEQSLFVGNSIGSNWITCLALERPERVVAMVHVGCPAFWLGTSAPLPLRLLSLPLLGPLIMTLSPPSPKQVESFGKNVAGEDLSRRPELRDLLLAAERLPKAQESILRLLRAALRLRGARDEVAQDEEQLARIRQPVLLIWGSRDSFGGPEVGKAAARVIPNAQLEIILEAGHVPWVGKVDKVAAAAVPFLRRHAIS